MSVIKNAALVGILLATAVDQAYAGMPWRMGSTANNTPATEMEVVEHPISLPKTMQTVQDMLDGLSSQPTCKRLAANKLLTACRAYDSRTTDDTRGTDMVLESYQKLFQVRMTQCDLQDANQDMPDPCKPLLDPRLESKDIAGHQMNGCLESLFQHGSQWLSYQTVKTNALIMCNAIRNDVEKDEQVHFFRILVGTVGNLSEVISMLGKQGDALLPQFNELSENVGKAMLELRHDHRLLSGAIQGSFFQLQNNITEVGKDVNSVSQMIKGASDHFDLLASKISENYQQSKELSLRNDAQQDAGFAKLQEDFGILREQVQSHVQHFVINISHATTGALTSLETVTALSNEVLYSLGMLDLAAPLERVATLNEQMDLSLEKQRSMSEKQEDMLLLVDTAAERLTIVSDLAGNFANLLGPMATFVSGVSKFTVVCSFMVTLTSFWYWSPVLSLSGASLIGIVSTLLLTWAFDPVRLIQDLLSTYPAISEQLPQFASPVITFIGGMTAAALALKKWHHCQSMGLPVARIDEHFDSEAAKAGAYFCI